VTSLVVKKISLFEETRMSNTVHTKKKKGKKERKKRKRKEKRKKKFV
jgi:hypothetical protein